MNVYLLLVSAATAGTPSEVVLLDFTATWCGPCQQMNPIISRLERQGYPIRRVDVDREPHLKEQFKIQWMPTFVLLVNGREVARRTGGKLTEADLKRMFDQAPRRAQQSPVEQELAANITTPGQRSSAPTELAPQRDDLSSRFQFPFPARPAARQPRQPRPIAPEAVPPGAIANSTGAAQPAASPADVSPADWDRPVIRAQNDRRPRTRAALDDLPLASSTRIRVRDNGGTVYASATVIDSRPGRSLLLTCGHVFRDLPQTAEIVVDVFVDGQPEQYLGQVVNFDLDSDVGLLAIATSDPLPVSPIATRTAPPALGQPVQSIGCGGGDPPTRRSVRVTGFQRNTPPTYVECTGAPEQGRSGGGLFNARGEVIGVCFAADNDKDRGLYASLPGIFKLLDTSGLSHLYRPGGSQPQQSAEDVPPVELARQEPGRARGPDDATAESVSLDDPPPFAVTDGAEPAIAAGSQDRQLAAAREALARPEDAEVICIIRSRSQPGTASRVVVIHRASPKFVSFLTGELRQQPQETARRVGLEAEPSPQDDQARLSASAMLPRAESGGRTFPEGAFLSALSSSSEPFSHFQMVSARGDSRDTQPMSIAPTTGEQRLRGVDVERYRRSAASRLAWPRAEVR